MEQLLKEFREASDLQKAIDPVEQPFESKYKARNLLSKIIEQVEGNDALIGALYANLGVIDIDVEELSIGEINLMKSLEHLTLIEDRQKVILSEIRALNQLGILWCLREDYEKAKTFLERSLQSYEKLIDNKDNRKYLYDIEDLFQMDASPSYEEKEADLELLNTHTHYYLAQVFEKIGQASKSAEHCHVTLSKQLELKQFQHLDWATNAAMLSQHYLAKEDYATTKRHLIAASVMLDRYESELQLKEVSEDLQDDRDEMLKRCKSDVARAWGKYCLLLMQRSMDKDIEKREQENQIIDIEDDEEKEKKEIVDFPTIETDPILAEIPERYATNFEEARAIFLPGQRLLNQAKSDYYKFEDHCVDYVEIQRDLSHMHKVLVYFEPDASRKFKIHKRRIDLLEPVYKELNLQLFTLLVRQLIYEVAETYSAMMDLKLESMISMTPNQIKKVNNLVDCSINAFKEYLNTLNKADGSVPDKYAKDDLRPALIAHFHLARLYDKYLLPDNPGQKIRNKVQTYSYYKHVVDYCHAHPDEAAQVMTPELPICEEMVLLLPRKIQKMQQELL